MMDVTDPHQFKAFFQVPDSLDHSPVKIPPRTFDKKPPNADSRKAPENKPSPSESLDENFNKKPSAAEDRLHSGETTPTGQAQFSFNDDEFANDSLDNDPEEHVRTVIYMSMKSCLHFPYRHLLKEMKYGKVLHIHVVD